MPGDNSMFGEDQGRYVVTVKRWDYEFGGVGRELRELPNAWDIGKRGGLHIRDIGRTGGPNLAVKRRQGPEEGYIKVSADIPLATLRAAHEGFFPALMDG